VNKHQK